MIVEHLDRLRDIVQEDVGQRGLRADPQRNLVSETSGDFRAACVTITDQRSPSPAGTALAGLAIVTGFFIPTANPPAGETDGPLGAVFLARASCRWACGWRSPSTISAHAPSTRVWKFAACATPCLW